MAEVSVTPDFADVLTNIAETLPSIYMVLGGFFFLIGFAMIFSGVMDLAQSTEKNKRYLGHQATGLSGIIKILLGGVMANFAANGDAAVMVSSIFFGREGMDFALVSIDSYQGPNDETIVSKNVKIVLFGLAQVVGLIAIFKGLRIWSKASDKSGKDGFWNGVNYIIFGTLCVQAASVLGVIQKTLGFEFFKMVGLV